MGNHISYSIIMIFHPFHKKFVFLPRHLKRFKGIIAVVFLKMSTQLILLEWSGFAAHSNSWSGNILHALLHLFEKVVPTNVQKLAISLCKTNTSVIRWCILTNFVCSIFCLIVQTSSIYNHYVLSSSFWESSKRTYTYWSTTFLKITVFNFHTCHRIRMEW